MPSDFFLAQTGAEMGQALPFAAKIAWLGCHFSPSGRGLSNFPTKLPAGSMLILTDETPVSGHEPERVIRELAQAVEKFCCNRVLLDFQRPENPEAAAMARAITQALPCPVGVTEPYAGDLPCPVFLTPLPLDQGPAQRAAQWKGREIWLEAAPQKASYHITKAGCQIHAPLRGDRFPHGDDGLFCRYRIELGQDAAIFTLCRTWEDWLALARSSQVGCVVGLYQEFAQPEAQATALAQ